MTAPGEADSPFYALENVHLTSVGIDVGSATTHLVFSRIHLRRRSTGLSSRYVVVSRQIRWASRICFTPYRPPGGLIDAAAVAALVEDGYRAAGLTPGDVHTGVVLLTGEALRQRNARAIADAVSAWAGDFVCVTAGHHLEALLSAHGSGAVRQSADAGLPVLCIDIGGGTTKFSAIRGGRVVATAAIDVGARMLAWDADGRVIRLTPSLRSMRRTTLAPGDVVPDTEKERLAAILTQPITDVLVGRAGDLDPSLLLTGPLGGTFTGFSTLLFTGGVAEYLYGRNEGTSDDLGPDIAAALRRWLGSHLDVRLLDPAEGIRATVVGASQWSVQVSGSTVSIGPGVRLPLRNVPVLHPPVDMSDGFTADQVSDSVVSAVRLQASERMGEVLCLSFDFAGPPRYARLRTLAEGISNGLRRSACRPATVVVLTSGDIAASLGGLLAEEVPADASMLCLDHIETQPFDYVDVGPPIPPAGVFPLVIKSLVFAAESPPTVGEPTSR